MAIAYRASGTFTEANSTSSGAVGLPAGLANGDVLVMLCQTRGTAGSVTTPSGYSVGGTIQITASHRFTVFYRYVANAGAEVAPTVTQSVSGAIRCRLSAFSGCDSTTQIDVTTQTAKHTASSTLTAPTITPASSGSMVLWCFSSGDDNALGSQTTGTLAYSSDGVAGADGSIALVYTLQTSATASGACSMTESANGPDNWCTITLALRASVTAATTPSRILGAPWPHIQYLAEMAFGETPFAPSPVWTDVSPYFLADSLDIARGKSSAFSDIQPGTIVGKLLNSDRRFDPDYTAGPYYGKLLPQVRFRLRVRWNSTTYPIFDGYVQGWPQEYDPPKIATVALVAVDRMAQLATRNLPAPNLLDVECITDGCVAHWPLDEDPGGFSGIAFDNSGNGVDGSWNGAAVDTFLVGEPGRKAKYFTYTDSIFQHFGASHVDGLDLTGMRTIEFWLMLSEFTPSSESAAAAFVPAHGDLGGIPVVLPPPIDPQIVIRVQSEVGFFYVNLHVNQTFVGDTLVAQYSTMDVNLYDATNTLMAVQPCPIFIGLPMHVVCVLDDAATALSVYLNGVQVGSSLTVSSGTFEAGSLEDSFAITGVGYVTAAFCHFAAYDVALTATQVAEHYVAGTTGGRGQSPADRLEVLADFAGLVDASLFDDSDLIDHTFLARSSFSGNVLTAMQDLVRTEQGRMFVDASGVLQVQGRTAEIHDLSTSTTVQATLDDTQGPWGYTDLELGSNELDLMKNTVYLSTNGGAVVVYDTDSRRQYGELSESLTVALDDATAARNLGLWRTLQFADPTTRVLSVTIKPNGPADPRWGFVFGVDIGWRVSTTQTPQGVGTARTKTSIVEGIHHHVSLTDGDGVWVTTLYLSPAIDTYTTSNWWILGDSTYGKLDGTHCKLPY